MDDSLALYDAILSLRTCCLLSGPGATASVDARFILTEVSGSYLLSSEVVSAHEQSAFSFPCRQRCSNA